MMYYVIKMKDDNDINRMEGREMKVREIMNKKVSDAIGNLIDVQELAHRLGPAFDGEGITRKIIAQEAGRIIEALNTLEGLFPDGTCRECGGGLNAIDRCDDPLCKLKDMIQY